MENVVDEDDLNLKNTKIKGKDTSNSLVKVNINVTNIKKKSKKKKKKKKEINLDGQQPKEKKGDHIFIVRYSFRLHRSQHIKRVKRCFKNYLNLKAEHVLIKDEPKSINGRNYRYHARSYQ